MKRQKGRGTEAVSVRAREASFSPTRTLVSPRAAAHTRAHTPPAPQWPFVCAHEPAPAPRPPAASPLWAHKPSRTDAQPARTGGERAQPGPGARGWGAEPATGGARAEAQEFTCAGQGPGGGEGQEGQQQPHPAQEQRRLQAGGRARRRPPGVPRPGGPGVL